MAERTAVVERPLRRDAELNLERILSAAQDVFARLGYDASMEQIATAAGVGVGTLYRRFPNKESLVVAVVDAAGTRCRLQAKTVLAECTEAEGIFEFMRRCLQTPSNLRALVSRSPKLEETHRTMIATVAPAIERLIVNAKAAGSLRPDVTFSDIAVILMSVRSVGDRCGDIGVQQAERHLQLLMDGLRVTQSAPLPHRPLTRAQLDVLLVRD
jgi:AcrR family transcriptional regulator